MIRKFADLSSQDVGIAGGKGASLGEMTNAGIPVPEGFELTLCEQQTPVAERRGLVARADHLLVYSVGFEDLDVAKKVRLVQLLTQQLDLVYVVAPAGQPPTQ